MMRTLLCTAPSSSTITSPIETSPPMNDIVAPPNSGGSSSSSARGEGPNTSPTSLLSNNKGRFNNFLSGKSPARRPSIRKRIQSLSSRVSAGSASSLDKATATLSSAAGSSFSFLRHASGSFGASTSTSTSPSSAGNASNSNSSSGPGTGSGSAHNRGASTSSFASGKSRSSKDSISSGFGLGHGEGKSRLNVLNIGPPSAFKHQFHVGPRSRTTDEPWDDTRWRQIIEMRGNTRGIDHNDAPVIDVVPPTTSILISEPRTSSSSERNVFTHQHSRSHSRSQSQSHTSASVSSPNLLSIATAISTSNSSPSSSIASSSISPANASTTSTTPTASAVEPKDGSAEVGAEGDVLDKAKTAKQAKRASLVKRKPVPQINPEDLEPMPSPSPAGGASSNLTGSPAPTAFVLMPDPAPASGMVQVKVPETASPGRTSFEAQGREEGKEMGNVLESAWRKEEVSDSEAAKKAQVGKEKEEKRREPDIAPAPESTQIQAQTHAQALPPGLSQSSSFAPPHICVLHSSPAPVPPPRRHTLAHMQAHALGRGMCAAPSLPSVPFVPPGPFASNSGTSETQTQEKTRPQEKTEKTQERKKSRARPLPIVAPSPGIVESVMSVTESDENHWEKGEETPVVGQPKEGAADETTKREEERPETETTTSASACADDNDNNSPRPSLASLASTEGSETARSVSSGTGSTLEMEMEPRTPTDERRVSAGSTASVKQRHLHLNGRRNRSVRIVLPGEFPATDDDDGEDGDVLTASVRVNVGAGEEEAKESEAEVETPKMPRRVSKRPNPPARRIEANEESVYVTADEADDIYNFGGNDK